MTAVHAAMGLTAQEVDRVLTAAAQAPSVHNTQPWRFRLTPSSIELHADEDRRLVVADPEGVEMRMSCGAALFNVRMALAQLGVCPDVDTIPDPARPQMLATITMAGRKQANPEENALARAIVHRSTNRRSFTDDPVSPAHRHHLRAAAHREGARLYLIEDHDQRTQLGRLSKRAHRVQADDSAFRDELASWSGHTGARTDGVPAHVGGPTPAYDESWVLRDFTGGVPPTPAGHTGYERRPLIAVLVMYFSGPGGDVRAGEALQRVLLTATVDGLSVSPVSQLIEVPEFRELTRQLIGAPCPPHAVLRVGYGWPVAAAPRRSVDELVMADAAAPEVATADGLDPHNLSQLW